MSAAERARARALLDRAQGWCSPFNREEEALLARLVEDGRWAEHAFGAVRHRLDAPALSRRMADGREAARQLELRLMGVVVRVARRYRGRGVEVEELVQEGWFGLRRAIERFDHRRGFRLGTYAAWWVHDAVQRAILRHGRIIRLPFPVAQRLKEVLAAEQALVTEGESTSPARIADRTGLGRREVVMLLQLATLPLALDAPALDRPAIADLLAAPSVDGSDRFEREELAEEVRRAVARLGDRERDVVQRRFGFRSEAPETLEAIAREAGLTRERIRQIEANALGKLGRDRHLVALWEA